mgnify:CR=1 FL=1
MIRLPKPSASVTLMLAALAPLLAAAYAETWAAGDFDLLAALSERPRMAFSRRQLIDAVWESTPPEAAPNALQASGEAEMEGWFGRLRRLVEERTRALLEPFTRGGRVRQLTRARKAVIIWGPPGR